ncbi:BspA family leucine-rich repeat surface protein [Adlercreutzia caecimuris]|uniref:BspA family leucine-rich repeat surface protein n=2 Tax=Adlercreutzia caecimuris TaxID=671266 RepID=UPI001C3EDF0B|nr:BspA family leucine-rich repeat surface protein [Adlercreutzia caecimuris]MCR2036491.1 BspA family leucine-rich repeat surface protein [Adlercreutzia caecimuris]
MVLHENHPVNFQAEGHLSIIRKFSITGYILRFGDQGWMSFTCVEPRSEEHPPCRIVASEEEAVMENCSGVIATLKQQREKVVLAFIAFILSIGCACALAFIDAHAAYADEDAYAILYSDGSLVMQRGETTDPGKTALYIYSGLESHRFSEPPWIDEARFVKSVSVNASLRPLSTERWFYKMENLQSITGLGNLDLSRVASVDQMFNLCSSLTAIDVRGLNTGSVEIFDYMFAGCTSLRSIDGLWSLDTSNALSMSYMFAGCSSLTDLDVSWFDVSKVEDMYFIFGNCYSLASIDTRGWKTSSLTHMTGAFSRCRSLVSLDLSSWDFRHTGIDWEDDFSGCDSLVSITLGPLGIYGARNMPRIDNGVWQHLTSNVEVSSRNDSSFLSPGTYIFWPTKSSKLRAVSLFHGFRCDFVTSAESWQLRYSPSQVFSGNSVTSALMNRNVQSWMAQNLQGGKRYFIQVRMSQNVNGRQYWSPWYSAGSVVAGDVAPGVYGLKENSSSNYFDVTGNGKLDTIKVKHGRGSTKFSIYVNGKKAYSGTTGNKYADNLSLKVLVLKNGKTFLYADAHGGGEIHGIKTIFQYRSGKMKKVVNCHTVFPKKYGRYRTVDTIKVSGNKVVVRAMIMSYTTGWMAADYTYNYKSGTLKQASKTAPIKKFYPAQRTTFKAQKSIKVYKSTSCKAKKFTIKKGQKVKFLKVYSSGKTMRLQVKVAGKTGWIKCAPSVRSSLLYHRQPPFKGMVCGG